MPVIAIYVRVSTQRQAQSQSTEQQLERLRAYVLAQNWDLAPEYIFRDDGYSGGILQRPGLDRLRDAVASARIDRILITAPDRLARNYVHQVLLVEELQRHGAEVEFLDRPMSRDPHDQLLLQIRGAVAEYERTLIAERMRRGRLRRLEAGTLLPWTQPPYGYRQDPDRPRDPAGVRDRRSPGRRRPRSLRLVRRRGRNHPGADPPPRSARHSLTQGLSDLEPLGPARAADQPSLYRPGFCQSRAHEPVSNAALGSAAGGSARQHTPLRRSRAVDRGRARTGPDHTGAVRPRGRAVGVQSTDGAAEQPGAPVSFARAGELRALPPQLHGPSTAARLRLLSLPHQGAAALSCTRRALPGSLHPGQGP